MHQIILKEENSFKSYEQVTLTVAKLGGTNAVFVADEVVALLEEHKEELHSSGIGYTITRNYGKRANEAVNELVHHLVITIVIIAGYAYLFPWLERVFNSNFYSSCDSCCDTFCCIFK